MKDRGVSVKVSSDFYRMMEQTRVRMKNRYGVNIKSHIKLTQLWSKNPKLFNNRNMVLEVKKWGY